MVGRDDAISGMVGGQTSSVQEETQSLWIDFRCSTDDDNVEGEETADRRRREGGKAADREHDEKLGLQKKHRRPNEFTNEVGPFWSFFFSIK